MNFNLLKEKLDISDLKDINQLKKNYKLFARKFHPDISSENVELFTKITTLYNEYLKLYKTVYEEDLSIKEDNNNNKWNNEKPKQEKNIEINIIIQPEDLLIKDFINIYINNECIKIKNEEIKELKGKINKKNIIINYSVRIKKDLYLDKAGKINQTFLIPFPFFIFGGNINIKLYNFQFTIKLEKNWDYNEILEIKNKKFKRQFFIKFSPIFPKNEELNKTEKKYLSYFYNNKV